MFSDLQLKVYNKMEFCDQATKQKSSFLKAWPLKDLESIRHIKIFTINCLLEQLFQKSYVQNLLTNLNIFMTYSCMPVLKLFP